MQRILICGSSSFASQGLVQLLESKGSQITHFNRGKLEHKGNQISGDVLNIDKNEFLHGPFDIVINYIVLKGQSQEQNRLYIKKLLNFCNNKRVRHLIHLSSVSALEVSAKYNTEATPTEADPDKKGSYGSLKIAADLCLVRNKPSELKLSLVRPGFVLGKVVQFPTVGNAFKTPFGFLLFGSPNPQMPLIKRDFLHQAILKIIQLDRKEPNIEIFHIYDSNSPSKRDYVKTAHRLGGQSDRLIVPPKWLWLFAGGCGEILSRLINKKELNVYRRIANACREKSFNSDQTQQLLGLSFSMNWQKVLEEAMDGRKK